MASHITKSAVDLQRLMNMSSGVAGRPDWMDNHTRDTLWHAMQHGLLDPKRGVTPPSNYSVYETPAGLLRAIAQRLRVPEGEMVGGFDTIYAHKSGEKVFVFVVNDGKAVIIEDDWTLFPSDRLVTQLRMLKG